MNFGQIDATAVAAIVVPVVVSIIGGGLAMAWRLGGLERSVKDMAADVTEMKGDMSKIETHVANVEQTANAAASAATAAAASVGVIANRTRRED